MNATRVPMADHRQVGSPHGNASWQSLLGLPRAATMTAMERIARIYQRRRAIRHLRSLSDHCLKDIGIDRSEIVSMVYGTGRDRSRRRAR